MKKIILLLISFAYLFAFSSKYFNGSVSINCDTVLHKRAFDICYSCSLKIPKLVAYSVDADLIDSKNLSRKKLRFKPDYQLPIKCRSYSKDYSKTGYDRGHMAPNAIFDYDRTVQKETFLMSNITPQKPNINRRIWAGIERFVRQQARKYKKINVLTGACGTNGKIRNGVNIPAYLYKIVITPKNQIGFLVPNRKIKKKRLKDFLVQISDIENVCKVRFSLP